MKKSIFTTRFKECCKEKGYTQQIVAEKLNISINGLKHHLRSKNPNFPPLDLLIKMAEIFDVDVAYLLGDINCKTCAEQKLFDISGLSKKPISLISKISEDYSWEFCRLVEIFAETAYLDELLDAIDDHCSAFDNNVASIRTEHKTSYYSTINIKEIAKAKIITIINKIIDDLSEFHLSLGPEEIVKNMAKELLIMIDEKKEEKNCDFEKLYKVVEFRLEEITKINSYDYISLCTPKQIVHEKNDMLKAIYFR